LMVKAAFEKPLRDAAEDFGCTHGKIDFWKKRFEQQGVRGLKTKRRPGRPPKITEEQSIVLKQTVSKNDVRQGWRTARVRELIRRETGVTYTKRHTIRILQKWGLARVTPRPRYAHSNEEDRKAFFKKTRPTWRDLTKQSGA
ncbi:MAG: winged helix-turn-helix domain-containing protein, partial [Bacteroidota bacterium]